MDFSLHQLRVFVAVVNAQSFSRAGEDLVLTQPAVSMQVKALERILGIPLFTHAGKRLQLTEAGKDLYPRATQILGLVRETGELMSDLREGRRGRLRVTATTTVGIYVVPTLLGAYHQRHPNVEVRLEVANWERARDRLYSGDADIAVAESHPQAGLTIEPFMEDELVVIAASTHPLAGKASISLEELAAQPMLMREPGSGTRIAVEKLFADRKLRPNRAMELSRNGAIKQVAKEGLGVAVISRAAVSLELTIGTLAILDVECFPLVRSWNIITRAGVPLSPAAGAFWDEVRQGIVTSPKPQEVPGRSMRKPHASRLVDDATATD